jgi:hypothetical protein
MQQRNVLNGLMKQQRQETAQFACGFCPEGSTKILAEKYIEKQMPYQKI